MTMMPQSILITGASSGLGAALAHHYAHKNIHLFLGGRDEGRLKKVKTTCEKRGATVSYTVVDVIDQTAMAAWIAQAHEHRPLDLVIANAGISAGTGAQGLESQTQNQTIFAVNVYGANNTIYPALRAMQQAGGGQIALVSSMAGFYGFPGAPAYCASKAAVRITGEALRSQYKPDNIHFNVICPGYIKTPMTDQNNFPMPGIMSAEKAAALIARGLARNKARIAFPWNMRFVLWWLTNLPATLADKLVAPLPTKPTFEEQNARN